MGLGQPGPMFASVEFHRLEMPAARPYDGPYQERLEPGPEQLEFITGSEGMTLSEALTTLSENVETLTRDVTTLTSEIRLSKWMVSTVAAVGLAVVGVAAAVN